MLKGLKKVFAGIVAISLVFVVGFGAVSAAPETIKVKRAEVLSALVDNAEYGFTIFTTEDGQVIYCMDVDKKALDQGQTVTLSGNGDAGLLYILQNGYPAKSITGNDEADKYITQAAVWWYTNEDKVSNAFKNATKETDRYQLVSKYIKPMVENARSAKNNQVAPKMDLTVGDTNFTLTSDGKYYESPYMSAALVGASTYDVVLTGGTKNTVAVDEKGVAKTKFNSSERLKIRVPAEEATDETKIVVKFTATGTTTEAKIYKPGNDVYQRVVGLYEDTIPLEKTVNLSVKGGTPEVVEVPNTQANVILLCVFSGILIIIVGGSLIVYAGNRKQKLQK